MKICTRHWTMMRAAVELRGMTVLVARDGSEAMERTVDELNGGDHKKNFDPLMSMHWHWTNSALANGGLYLMGKDESGANDGEYCPVCEFSKHAQGFDALKEINDVADQMVEWCRTENLLALPS